MEYVGIILLAAGGSVRMGRPKQLLVFQGQSLVQHAARVARVTRIGPVVLVVGANADAIADDVKGIEGITVQKNPEWEKGMGTSIRAGVKCLLADHPHVRAVLILLCDQPFVEPSHLQELCRAFEENGKGVIASRFGDTVGPPCLFAARWFPKLLALPDGEGAKSLIMSAGEDCHTIQLEAAEIDIDTPEDYERVCKTR